MQYAGGLTLAIFSSLSNIMTNNRYRVNKITTPIRTICPYRNSFSYCMYTRYLLGNALVLPKMFLAILQTAKLHTHVNKALCKIASSDTLFNGALHQTR